MSATARPSFGEALRFWLKLGSISFGGPAGQIALIGVLWSALRALLPSL